MSVTSYLCSAFLSLAQYYVICTNKRHAHSMQIGKLHDVHTFCDVEQTDNDRIDLESQIDVRHMELDCIGEI